MYQGKAETKTNFLSVTPQVCDFFLDKKERGNEINIRAIITAIDHANSSAGLSAAERKAVEEKQRELLVKVCVHI